MGATNPTIQFDNLFNQLESQTSSYYRHHPKRAGAEYQIHASMLYIRTTQSIAPTISVQNSQPNYVDHENISRQAKIAVWN
jgi:hypothetical protein